MRHWGEDLTAWTKGPPLAQFQGHHRQLVWAPVDLCLPWPPLQLKPRGLPGPAPKGAKARVNAEASLLLQREVWAQ